MFSQVCISSKGGGYVSSDGHQVSLSGGGGYVQRGVCPEGGGSMSRRGWGYVQKGVGVCPGVGMSGVCARGGNVKGCVHRA